MTEKDKWQLYRQRMPEKWQYTQACVDPNCRNVHVATILGDKWQLYAQTGVDGAEYGIRIRPGYTVVGFQKEDVEEILRLREEVERLRSEMDNYGDDYVCQMKCKDARIKELEAKIELSDRMAKEQIENSTALLNGHITKEERDEARIEELEAFVSNHMTIHDSVYLKRLEAAFLESEARWLYPFTMPMWDNLPEEDFSKRTFGDMEQRHGKAFYREKARAALEELRK